MPITQLDRQKINHELKRLGFGGLDDRNLYSQIATLYTTHQAFRGLLMSTAPDQRRVAYEALRPHLCFAAKPLDVYEMEIKQRAEREQWDVYNRESHYTEPFKVGEVESDEYRLNRLAQEAIEQQAHAKAGGVLELVCTKCTYAHQFPGKTKKDAQKTAQSAGWRWAERNGVIKIYCPKDVPGRATMTLECGECPRKARIRVWDEQDGYRDARLLGWEVGGATDVQTTKCPTCAAKTKIQLVQ